MIITNQTSKCCGAALLANMNDEGTCFYRCSKCNSPTDAVSDYKFQEIEVETNTTIHHHTTGLRPELHSHTVNIYQKEGNLCDIVLKLETRISELENEVANLRASKV